MRWIRFLVIAAVLVGGISGEMLGVVPDKFGANGALFDFVWVAKKCDQPAEPRGVFLCVVEDIAVFGISPKIQKSLSSDDFAGVLLGQLISARPNSTKVINLRPQHPGPRFLVVFGRIESQGIRFVSQFARHHDSEVFGLGSAGISPNRSQDPTKFTGITDRTPERCNSCWEDEGPLFGDERLFSVTALDFRGEPQFIGRISEIKREVGESNGRQKCESPSVRVDEIYGRNSDMLMALVVFMTLCVFFAYSYIHRNDR